MVYFYKSPGIISGMLNTTLNNIRWMSVAANPKIGTVPDNALPFNLMPGPKSINFITSFFPGAKYYKKTTEEVFKDLRQQYGDVYVLKGAFGKRDTVVTFKPDHVETVFRNEGKYPTRRAFDTVMYYRKVLRNDFYEDNIGLVEEYGDAWINTRSAVNPILMHPKSVNNFIPHSNTVCNDFVERIRNIRDPHTNEVPSSFDDDLRKWTLEIATLAALDKRLNLFNSDVKNPLAERLFDDITIFFDLFEQLDVKPSLWKIYPTKKFNQMIATMDRIFEFSMKCVDEALERIKAANPKPTHKMSILEQALNLDKKTAAILGMDVLFGGVDTTFAAISACIYQIARNKDKQDILRKEIRKILPNKNSTLTEENMSNLPYLRACIKEALRICPVNLGLARTTKYDIVLNGYHVPAGTDVTMMTGLLCNDETQFVQPSKFLPERWLRNAPESTVCPANKKAHPFSYLPFGFGPRICAGKRLVGVEMESLMAKLIRNFYVEFNHDDWTFKSTVLMSPVGSFKFKFVDVNN